MKKVKFEMVWQVCGKQTIEVPDEVDISDEEAIKDYIRENWEEIPLPTDCDFIPGSDELDELVPIEIYD